MNDYEITDSVCPETKALTIANALMLEREMKGLLDVHKSRIQKSIWWCVSMTSMNMISGSLVRPTSEREGRPWLSVTGGSVMDKWKGKLLWPLRYQIFFSLPSLSCPTIPQIQWTCGVSWRKYGFRHGQRSCSLWTTPLLVRTIASLVLLLQMWQTGSNYH